MWKHAQAEHDGNTENLQFTFNVIKKHSKPPQRKIHKAVYMSKKSASENLNSKNEFNYNNNNKLKLIQNKQNFYNCKICGAMFDKKHDVSNHEEKFHNLKECNVCDYECFGQTGLNEHVKTKHTTSQ